MELSTGQCTQKLLKSYNQKVPPILMKQRKEEEMERRRKGRLEGEGEGGMEQEKKRGRYWQC